jgi:hypothetical protein
MMSKRRRDMAISMNMSSYVVEEHSDSETNDELEEKRESVNRKLLGFHHPGEIFNHGSRAFPISMSCTDIEIFLSKMSINK